MNKKILIAPILLIAFLAILFLFQSFKNPASESIYSMTGQIVEVKDHSLVIEGVVTTDDQSADKTVEFTFDEKTTFKKMTIVITEEQFNSGESFQPETPITLGVASDLEVGVRILKIQSEDDLVASDKARATEIYYLLYDFPDVP